MSLALGGTTTARPVARRIGDTLVRWARHETAFGRFALWLPVLTAAGIAAGVAAPFDPEPLIAGAVLATLMALRALAARTAALAHAAGPLLALAAFAGGTLMLALQAEWRGTALLQTEQTVTMTARVTATEDRGASRQRLILAPLEGDFRGPVPHRVRVSVRGGPDYRVGERVSLTARLFPLRGPVYPGGYDSARRLFFDRVGATGFSYGPPDRLAPPPGLSLTARIGAMRDAVQDRIVAALEEGNAAFASALLVGRRGLMSFEDVEALRISGLGHILAISGLHMALVAGSVFAAVRLGLALVPRVALRWPIRKLAAVAGLAAATVYLALSGGSVATLRAYVMLAVALVAILADRPALTMRTVAVAAVVLMALDPVSVVEPGFQMSFLAVVALVGAYEWWAGTRFRIARGWGRPVTAFIIGLAATSLIAGLATAPAAAYHFHRLAPLGLVANLAAMPVLSLLAMPCGVIALLLMPFGLEGVPLAVMDHGLSAILWVAREVADWTGSSGVIGAIPPASALLPAFGLLWLAIFTAPWRLTGIAFILAGLALVPLAPRYDLLVAADGVTVAARGADGRLSILGDADGFAAMVWLKADGDGRPPGPGVAGGRCDPLGCTLPLADGRVAVPGSPRALLEDCRLAVAVVTVERVTRCPAPLVIDRRRLARTGAIAAVREGDGWRVVPARPDGMVRKWHLPPQVPRQ